MERYLGLDMHRDSCTAVVLSAGGKKSWTAGGLPATSGA